MSAGTTNQPGQDGAAIGVGGVTSGQEGATAGHETQQETGGSGGEQLTASQGEAPGSQDRAGAQSGAHAEARPAGVPPLPPQPVAPADTSMHSGARGAFDTRAEQAGGTGTGLGSPESGANQSPEDLAPPAGGKA